MPDCDTPHSDSLQAQEPEEEVSPTVCTGSEVTAETKKFPAYIYLLDLLLRWSTIPHFLFDQTADVHEGFVAARLSSCRDAKN